MPRTPRYFLEDQVVHVLNRANQRQTIFHRPADYDDFVELLSKAKDKAGASVRLYAFCLMPNHFHAVLHAPRAADLGTFMSRWVTPYLRRHHAVYGQSGHLFQGRYKSFPVQSDAHLSTVLRYVLLNPLRAGLARDVSNWRWSSLHRPDLVDVWPIPMPREMGPWLSEGYSPGEGAAIRHCIQSSTPYGAREWCEKFRVPVSEDGWEVPF